jgi:membrane protein DedA with SNARE-associated domain
MTSLIARFGALGVFALMVPESACIPIPSELTLLFSGYAVDRGWISFPLAILAATAGNVVGSLLAYGLGASGLPDRVPGLRGVLGRWESMLDRRGTRAVLIARLLPLARTFVSLPAGARRVPLAAFVALTVIGSALWATAFVLAGMLAGGAWSSIGSVVGKVGLGVGIVVLVVSASRRPNHG